MLKVNYPAQDLAQPESQTTESQHFAAMTDAELLSAFEFCRIGCGIHEAQLPRERTMLNFRLIWSELRLRERKRLQEL